MKFNWNQNVENKFIDENQNRLLKIGFSIERDIKLSMQEKGSGKVYWKGKYRDIMHQASAAGETPAVDTGRLRASITTAWPGGRSQGGKDAIESPPKEFRRFVVRVGTNVEYGVYLELGTSKLAPRPFLRPALERHREELANMGREK